LPAEASRLRGIRSEIAGRLGTLIFEQSARLVVPAFSDGRELLLVLTAVVCAEQQFAVLHDDTNISLGTASVAAIGCGELVGGTLVGYGTIFGGDLGHFLLLQIECMNPVI
jgi:hypothetical protein